jgi:hypothetical protein
VFGLSGIAGGRAGMRAYTCFARRCGLVTLPPVTPDEISVSVISEAAGVVHLVVRVRPSGGGEARGRRRETSHEVTLARTLLERLAPGEAPASFIRRCFEFLLEREPSDAILRQFDAAVIGRYFPEFERTIAKR